MQSQRQELLQAEAMRSREESLTELLGNLANQSASLVRDEVALAKQELSEKMLSFRSSVTLLSAGIVVGLLAAMALCAATIAALSLYLQVWVSALLVGGALALVAGIVIASGISQLKNVNLKPEQTIETLGENKEWLKELT